MKLFAVALIAAVVFAVSSAAPTIYEPLFDELESEANVTKYVAALRCSIKVASNASEVYGQTELWSQYQLSIEEHINNILSNCSETENATKCSEIESDQAKEVFNDFLFSAYGEENGQNLVNEIMEAYEAQCKNVESAETSGTFELSEETPETFADYVALGSQDSTENGLPEGYVASFECAIDAGRQVTHDYELPAVWREHELKLLAHLAKVKDCLTVEDEAAVQACQEREHKAATEAFRAFMRAVLAENLYATYELIDILKARCGISNKSENSAKDDPIVSLTCAIKVGREVTHAYELPAVWRKYEPKLLAHLAKLKDCAKVDDASALHTCQERERNAATQTYRAFVLVVKDVDLNASIEILERFKNESKSIPARLSATFELNNVIPLCGAINYADRLDCAIRVGETTSTEFGLEVVITWKMFERPLLEHLENVTNCASAGDSEAVHTCTEQEFTEAWKTYTTFVHFVREVDETPEAAAEIVRRYTSECVDEDSTETPTN